MGSGIARKSLTGTGFSDAFMRRLLAYPVLRCTIAGINVGPLIPFSGRA
jgi:hypothetical protein